jgi:hypothetical protein
VTERPDWTLSRGATRVALLVSWPFTVLGSLMLLPPRGEPSPGWGEAYGFIYGIYFVFGYPLTHIAFILRPRGEVEPGDYWWAIPLLNFLFFWQWMIWTQLLALAGKGIDWLCWRDENKRAESCI